MIWKVALRIARREALRHKGRSLLVAAMLALPVAGASAADTLYYTSKLTTDEQVTRDMGHADAIVSYIAPTHIQQLPSGQVPSPPQSQDMLNGALQGVQIAAPTDVLPKGSRLVPLPGAIDIRVRSPHGYLSVRSLERDLADPLMAGMYERKSGVAPTAKGQVALSTTMLASLGKHVGDTVSLEVLDGGDQPDAKGVLPEHTVLITGEFDDPSHLDHDLFLTAPGTLPVTPGGSGPSAWLASVPGGLSWHQVLGLNDQGYSAESRVVSEHPPADADVPFYAAHSHASAGSSRLTAAVIAVGLVAVVMALLEVVLLAGPAFAVGARRRRRDFGLIGAAGADRRKLRVIVLADGVLLGAAGGVLGIAVGVLSGWAVLPQIVRFTHSEPGALRIVPTDLAVSATLGVATGLLAAMVPAVTVSRQDVLTALTGRRGVVNVPWKLPLIGLVTIVVGVAATAYGAFQPGIHTIPLVIGIAISELGVVACTPLLVALTGKLARWLPLTGRLALRDSARNRGRTAPAVAAILAAVAGSTAVAVILTTNDARDRAQYHSTLRPGQVGLFFNGSTLDTSSDSNMPPGMGLGGFNNPAQDDKPIDAPKAVSAISATLPVRSAAVISVPDYRNFNPTTLQLKRAPGGECPFFGPNGASVAGGEAQATIEADPRCTVAFGPSYIIPGDVSTLRAITGTVDPDAEAVLAAGGIVVFSQYDLSRTGPSPQATLALQRYCPTAGQDVPAPFKAETDKVCSHPAPDPLTLPAAVAHVATGSPLGSIRALIPQSAADRFGQSYRPSMILFDTTRMPTGAEEQNANSAAESLGIADVLKVERGYQGAIGTDMLALAAVAALVTLGAAAIATGLAITDAQADLETLTAVGARPRARRALAGSQATVTAAMGAVLGSVTGLVPAVGIIEARSHSFVQSVADAAGGPGRVRSVVHASSYLTIPWWFVTATIVVVPLLAGCGAALVTRSKVVMRRRP